MLHIDEHTHCNYPQGIHAVVNDGEGEFLITLQRKLASSVALKLKISLFVEDNIYSPVALKSSKIYFTEEVFLEMTQCSPFGFLTSILMLYVPVCVGSASEVPRMVIT